jgi:hypothetical protein
MLAISAALISKRAMTPLPYSGLLPIPVGPAPPLMEASLALIPSTNA